MGKGRIEAFSDGVIAIIITIMVLELKVPEGFDLESLRPVIPVFLAYVLSFLYVGIYWNNHHHLLHATRRISGAVLWANLHLLFWLSLFPFATAWMGENHNAPVPTDFIDSTLNVPHPGEAGLFIKLRDDPSSVNTVTLTVVTDPKVIGPEPSAAPPTETSQPATQTEPPTQPQR